MYRKCRQIKPDRATPGELLDLVWRVFLRHESTAVSVAPEGIGEFTGDRIYLKYLVDRGSGFFTLEVLDKAIHECWQLCVAPTSGSRRVVSIRSVWVDHPASRVQRSLMDEVWDGVFSNHVQNEEFAPKADPHFMATVGAALSSEGLTSLSDDAAQVASLTYDLEYWRDLAKRQAKALKERDLPVKPFPEIPSRSTKPGPELGRVWRLDELDQWSVQRSDQIVVLPRAIAAAKRSNYENPGLVYDCLEMLATIYPKVKSGELDRHAFKRRAEELGLNFGGSVEPSNAGDEYFVRWGGRRRFLDQHLTKGSARDPRFSMRIYFTFCDDAKQVIVGWLPSHLGTGRS